MAYVEIEKVLETVRNGYHSDFGRSCADITSLEEVLEDTPKADVVEVKHGTWLQFRKPMQKWVLECSLCGNATFTATNYCSNCGAEMNKETEN